MTLRLLLVRHGHVDFTSQAFRTSPRGRQWDPPLDDVGSEQAASLTARLRLMARPAAVVVSPFARCRETIAPYLEETGLEAAIDEDLGEVFIGEWEGVRFEDVISGDEELARRFREQDPMFSLSPGGESGPQLRARVIPAVEAAIARAAGANEEKPTVLVVSHGGVINAYLGRVLDVPHDMFFLPENASINTVEVDGDARRIRFLNDVRHLTDPAVFAPPSPVGD
jgi:probable phosphoglycerate mutase